MRLRLGWQRAKTSCSGRFACYWGHSNVHPQPLEHLHGTHSFSTHSFGPCPPNLGGVTKTTSLFRGRIGEPLASKPPRPRRMSTSRGCKPRSSKFVGLMPQDASSFEVLTSNPRKGAVFYSVWICLLLFLFFFLAWLDPKKTQFAKWGSRQNNPSFKPKNKFPARWRLYEMPPPHPAAC